MVARLICFHFISGPQTRFIHYLPVSGLCQVRIGTHDKREDASMPLQQLQPKDDAAALPETPFLQPTAYL